MSLNKLTGFIGLGRMGRGMAKNLRKAGVPLIVYDADPNAAQELATQGAQVAASPEVVAQQSDLIFLCLPFSPEVNAVLFGDAGVTQASRACHIIDTTTQNYSTTLDIAEQAKAANLRYNDCPISGMPFRAEDGSLTMMFGGDEDAYQFALPYLNAMGSNIVHCGDVGMGQVMKAINNVIYNINIAAISELLPLATKVGLKPETVADVVTSGSSRSFASEYFVPRMLNGEFDSDFPMGAAYKDIVNVQEIATQLNACIPVANAMTGVYQATMAQGYADTPKSAMLRYYESIMGVEFRATDT